MIAQAQALITAWSVPFYGDWSVMKIFYIFVVLTVAAAVVNYFLNKAGGGQ